MKILPQQQGTLEWLVARSGIPTASELDNLVTPLFKLRESAGRDTYLARKLGERWLGGPLAGFNSFDTDQGHLLEEEAIPRFQLDHGVQIERVGLITTDEGMVGCSPDGLFADGTGIEIKCPAVHTHIGYLLAGVVPKEYLAQVHGSMYVTDAPSWTFYSYCRRFPPLLIKVMRDERIQAVLHQALSEFVQDLNAAYDRLVAINGGPPWRSQIPDSPPESYQSDQSDQSDVPH